MDIIQKHIRVSKDTSDWLENEAERLMIPQTNLIQLIIDQHIQTKKATDMGEILKELAKQIEEKN